MAWSGPVRPVTKECKRGKHAECTGWMPGGEYGNTPCWCDHHEESEDPAPASTLTEMIGDFGFSAGPAERAAK